MRRFYKMKRFAKFSVVALFLGTLFAVSPSPGQSNGQTGCSLVEQALKDYQQAKSAKTRQDVEKYYVLDGGAQFPSRTRYVYPKCEYLHVDFEFELAKPAAIATLPDDKVIGVSKIYVEYPSRD